MKLFFIMFVIFIIFLGCDGKRGNQLNKNENQIEENNVVSMEEELDNRVVLQYDYGNDNGTVLRIENIQYVKWVFRKHEQRVFNNDKLIILDEPNGIELFSIEAKEYINIFELALEEDLLNKSTKCWLKIKMGEGKEGWVRGYNIDPYADGLGSFIEIINIGNKDWTVIKLNESDLYAVNELNVRNKPGLIDTKVLFQFNYERERLPSGEYKYFSEYSDELRVTVLAMTKEKETVNDEALNASQRVDSWIKIRTIEGLEGWVFGGYLEQGQRGGPKIYTPEVMIKLMFDYI